MQPYAILRHGLSALLLGLSARACAAAQTAPALGPRERAYLERHPELRLCVDPDWMPYERLDANGRHQGLIAEYMAMFPQRLGVRKGDTLLHAIVNRQVQALSAEDHARIRRAWLHAGVD